MAKPPPQRLRASTSLCTLATPSQPNNHHHQQQPAQNKPKGTYAQQIRKELHDIEFITALLSLSARLR